MKVEKFSIDLCFPIFIACGIILAIKGLVSWWVFILILFSHFKFKLTFNVKK
jgi:hypothetical protein